MGHLQANLMCLVKKRSNYGYKITCLCQTKTIKCYKNVKSKEYESNLRKLEKEGKKESNINKYQPRTE